MRFSTPLLALIVSAIVGTSAGSRTVAKGTATSDDDLIAVVYPVANDGGIAQHAIESSRVYAGPQQPGLNSSHGIEMRFSHVVGRAHGLVFGSGKDCDVVIPHDQVSHRHFALTFDKQKRLVAKDLKSRTGTQVLYDEKDTGYRIDGKWILNGHSTIAGKSITIKILPDVAFRVVIHHKRVDSEMYAKHVHSLFDNQVSPEELISCPCLTRGNHNVLAGSSIKDEPVIIRRELGTGYYGRVALMWYADTGYRHVLKEPKNPGNITRDAMRVWKTEINMMKGFSHPHIVRHLGSTFSPYPQLYLEHAPRGSLDQEISRSGRFSSKEVEQILHQGLSALVYMHSRNISHRDIKLANILVFSRNQGRVNTKLGDFGTAKSGSVFNTYAGTPRFGAPELFETARQTGTYTNRADVWALGVVAYSLLYKLPDSPPKTYIDADKGIAWCKAVVAKFNDDWSQDPKSPIMSLLSTMLVYDQNKRASAEACHSQALRRPEAARATVQPIR